MCSSESPCGRTLCQLLSEADRGVNGLDDQETAIKLHQQWLVPIIHHQMVEKIPIFRYLSPGIRYTGSHAGNTRVGIANEFDVDFLLRFPAELTNPPVVETAMASMVRLKYANGFNMVRDELAELRDWLTAEGYLKRDVVRQWMKNNLNSILKSLESIEYIANQTWRVRKMGPASTLDITLFVSGNWVEYSIDFVPAVLVSSQPLDKKGANFPAGDWFVVPRPERDFNDVTYWRTSFPDQEDKLFQGKRNLLPTLRLIKMVRNKQGWELDIFSYYIKTMFLWEANAQTPDFWNKCIGDLFVHMLKAMRKCLQRKSIPYFWDRRQNMLQLETDDIATMKEKVQSIINIAERAPETILQYLETK